MFAFPVAACVLQRFTGTRLTASGSGESRSNVTSTDMETTSRFAICIEADPEDDVELQKVYPVLDDEDAEKDGMLRVIDESGEDYLYETARFLVLRLPATEAHTLLRSIEVATSTHR